MKHALRTQAARWLLIVGLVLAQGWIFPAASRANQPPGYVALGDSIEFGVGATNNFGYVARLSEHLAEFELHNLAQPGATVRDIRQHQLQPAITAIQSHAGAEVVISWGGGGNDLLQFVLSPEAATCRQQVSCLNRLNALLNEIEQTVDRTIRELREAVGPEGVILIRTQYNALLKTGCDPDERAALASIAMEGLPDSHLDQGLNDRLRAIAARYDAEVIELFLPFAQNPDGLIAADCLHPNDAGHALIAQLAIAALTAN